MDATYYISDLENMYDYIDDIDTSHDTMVKTKLIIHLKDFFLATQK